MNAELEIEIEQPRQELLSAPKSHRRLIWERMRSLILQRPSEWRAEQERKLGLR